MRRPVRGKGGEKTGFGIGKWNEDMAREGLD
jgi:hypothetical protein